MTDPLRFVLDENMRGMFLDAIHRHNLAFPGQAIDVEQVGDPVDLPRNTPDPELLIWAERENRLLISWDKSTLPGHLQSHLAAGHRCPGILIPPRYAPIRRLIERLVLISYASMPGEYDDQVTYIELH